MTDISNNRQEKQACEHLSQTGLIFLFTILLINILSLNNAIASPRESNFSLNSASIPSWPIFNLPPQSNLTIDSKSQDENNLSIILDFSKMKPISTFTLLKEKYLTLYSGKQKKLNADYIDGAYALNYTQRW